MLQARAVATTRVTLFAFFALIALVGVSPTLIAQCDANRTGVTDAQGTVFVDSNENGERFVGSVVTLQP